MINICNGDIFSIKYDNENILVHQCNCVTNYAKGLAKTVFDLYPDANIYKSRNDYSKPGDINIILPIVNLFGQRLPGKPNKYETKKQRLEWFKICLINLKNNLPENIKTINFPWQIGCGLAGGNWDDYLYEINQFASSLPVNIKVNIWKLDD
jgi:hypothetical protein